MFLLAVAFGSWFGYLLGFLVFQRFLEGLFSLKVSTGLAFIL